jgi:alcohol/geraniol dehydrogenase (NADP+)
METIQVRALAASKAKGKLEPFEFSLGSLAADQVDIKVEYCGICHSDLSILNNEFGFTQYPFVPGHEAVGVITGKGDHVPKLEVGQTVGLGWYSGSCMACSRCLAGDHNHCTSVEQTIIGRHGAFATHVRCHWVWATPIPQNIDHRSAGPLFCGGITVFNPIIQHDISPLARVGVIGIGGLGHLALQFLRHWGCEVYAFTSTDSKREEAIRLGAHQVINSRHDDELSKIRGALDLILVTVNVPLDWAAYFDCLAPKGVLHFVGIVPEPVSVMPFTLIAGQKSVSGTPLGSPSNTRRMIEFCARHQIAPVIETFQMSRANEALEHLEAGKARYRIVLENDLR